MNIWNDPAADLDARTDALLGELSLAEKIGQLGSWWPTPKGQSTVAGDVAPMESALTANALSYQESMADGLGHITRCFGTEPLTVAEGVANLRRYQTDVVAASRLGIPAIAHEECLTGFTAYGATVYPAAIAWGATFDPGLVQEMAAHIGRDMARVGVHQGLSPLLDVVRDYRWGRVEETCGEDPYLVGTLGTAYVQGLQSAGISATLKHFAGYSAAKAGRNHAPVPMGRREFEDVMVPPFEMAVREGGTESVMNSYSDIDGVPAGASVELLTGVLRDRWGFKGTVVSDYWSVLFLEMMHHAAADATGAAALALTAGIDVELPGTGCYQFLAEALDQGLVDEALINRATRRVLRHKIALGLLDDGWDPAAQGQAATDLDSPANRQLARRMADQSIVLAANTGILPLAEGTRVALTGPTADDLRTFMGCYSFPNHVMARYANPEPGIDVPTLLQSLRNAGVTVDHTLGVPILGDEGADIDAAVASAKAADVAIVCVGDLAGLFGMGTSGEGCDVVDLRLPGRQADLVEAVLATGTPVVLVIVSGRPYALGDLAPRCAAVVQAFMPGEEGGPALAGVLTGAVNPSGKLPVGLPNNPGGQPGTYLAAPLAWNSLGVSNLDPTPLFPFGHGLSYTTFEVSDAELSTTEVPSDASVGLSVTVTNTGDRAGAEVVQVYLHDDVAQVARPIRQLIGYHKVWLEPAASARLTFDLHTDRFSFTGVEYDRIVEPGTGTLLVGTSSEDLPITLPFTITGGVRTVGEGRVLVTPVSIA